MFSIFPKPLYVSAYFIKIFTVSVYLYLDLQFQRKVSHVGAETIDLIQLILYRFGNSRDYLQKQTNLYDWGSNYQNRFFAVTYTILNSSAVSENTSYTDKRKKFILFVQVNLTVFDQQESKTIQTTIKLILNTIKLILNVYYLQKKQDQCDILAKLGMAIFKDIKSNFRLILQLESNSTVTKILALQSFEVIVVFNS